MWICVVIAIARPQIIEPPITKTVPTRDLLLAVDLSGSMDTQDFTNAEGETTDRLTAVKDVIDGFLTRREGDRVGLIFFGSAAFVQAPFTEDLDVCRRLLDEAQVRMAGPKTALGDAMGLAISVFESSEVNDRVLIALTDGNDTGSSVPPTKAAEIARDKGLEQVSRTTGGLYSFAANREELEQTYQRLDELETREVETISHRPRTDIYWWILAIGFVLTLVQHAVQIISVSWKATQSSESSESESLVFASLVPFGAVGLFGASDAFHFLRPMWLLSLIPAALLLWGLHRAGDRARPFRGVIAAHLLPYLLSRTREQRRLGPLVLIGLGWLICAVALSGPTWRKEPNPFAEDTATMAIVVRVSESMKTPDVQPDRLTRSTQKIDDLLRLRQDGKTALIAYDGSAHVVMPPTSDGGIIESFARSLDPEIMPVKGDVAVTALDLADETIAREGGGTIVWITDRIELSEVKLLDEWRGSSTTPVILYPPLLDGKELNDLLAATRTLDADVIRMSADDADMQRVARSATYSSTSVAGTTGRWEDGGYWLVPLLAIALLPFFRRGWMVSTATRK
jgi:Ca-activated chloride channel family protein